MFKKMLIIGAAVSLAAVGAVSASSLGSVNQPTLASSNVSLNGCEAKEGGANVSFGTQLQENGGPPPYFQVLSIKVSNLKDSCNGKYLLGKFYNQNGNGFGPFFASGLNCSFVPLGGNTGQIAGGSVEVTLCPPTVRASEVYGVNLLVKDTPS